MFPQWKRVCPFREVVSDYQNVAILLPSYLVSVQDVDSKPFERSPDIKSLHGLLGGTGFSFASSALFTTGAPPSHIQSQTWPKEAPFHTLNCPLYAKMPCDP